MNGRNIPRIGILILMCGLLVSSCSEEKKTTAVERSIAVNAQVVRASDETLVRTFTGSLEGEKQAVLYAKLAEAVQTVHVKEGQKVTANQVIVSLDKDGPSARFNETRSIYLNAEKNTKKMENLFKSGAISETQYDGARTEYEVAKANFESVSRLVDVRTPIAGVVTSVDVSPGDFVNVGEKLALVATPGRLRVKFPVNTDNIQYISRDAEVRIVSDVVRDTVYGKIISIAESADPATRSFQVEALLDNQSTNFRPGMFVKIQVTEQKLPNVVSITREAVVQLDNQNTVFVVVNGAAQKRVVQLGPELEGRVVITGGIQPGDTVVTLGQSYLDDGFKVTLSAVTEG